MHTKPGICRAAEDLVVTDPDAPPGWDYNPASWYRPPLFLHDPQRQDYGCHRGSWGADFVEPIKQLTAQAHARVVEKSTFDAFFETELRGFLRCRQIATLYVAGIETNVCTR